MVIEVSFLPVILTIYHLPTEFSYMLFTGLFALQLTEECCLIKSTLLIIITARSFRT